MRFQKYIKEEETSEVLQQGTDAYKDMIALLKRDCQQAIQIYDVMEHKLLYRGVNWKSNFPNGKDFFKRERRTDRRPLSTSPKAHAILDKVFERVFGWKVRSSGVFASCDISDAHYYGAGERTYYFFPCDKWTYLWSPIVKDSIELDVDRSLGQLEFDGIKVTYAADIDTFGKNPEADKKWGDDMVKVVKRIYKNNDIDSYFKRKSTEIMINCDYYYMINVKNSNIFQILEDVKK
jgi:hypothetical protein